MSLRILPAIKLFVSLLRGEREQKILFVYGHPLLQQLLPAGRSLTRYPHPVFLSFPARSTTVFLDFAFMILNLGLFYLHRRLALLVIYEQQTVYAKLNLKPKVTLGTAVHRSPFYTLLSFKALMLSRKSLSSVS